MSFSAFVPHLKSEKSEKFQSQNFSQRKIFEPIKNNFTFSGNSVGKYEIDFKRSINPKQNFNIFFYFRPNFQVELLRYLYGDLVGISYAIFGPKVLKN